MKTFRIFAITFTIWIMAALINAAFIVLLQVFASSIFESLPGAFIFALFFSLLFSAPGIFIFWIVFMINSESENLFKILLVVAFIIASLSEIIVFHLLYIDNEIKISLNYMIMISSVAAITAVMAHHKYIKGLDNNNTTYKKETFNENNKN